MLIYLPVVSPRSEYIFEVIFKNNFGIGYDITSDWNIFKAYEKPKINYSKSRRNNEFFIQAAPLLFENFIQRREIAVEEKNSIKVLFANNGSCDMGFDVFSAVFFMLCRYEEYLPFIADKHGRFEATDTIAFKNNFLQIPIVDIWIDQFKNALQSRFPSLKFSAPYFKATVTYDIDVAYKYKGRSFKRNAGSTGKDLLKFDFQNIYHRIQTLLFNQKDPWDVYDYLQELIQENNLNSIFFFLLGDHARHDRNLDFKNVIVKKLVDKIKSFSEIGIHPSYKTSSFPAKISLEKRRLENLSGKNIYKSRQHFLKFTLPETYNALMDAGITEDYSMGFSALPGFRAGTSKPFYFYDLKNEKTTALRIFPVTLMEDTFMNLKYQEPEQALPDIFNLIDAVKNVNGTFISIWHNHTVSETIEYRNWKKVHAQMIERILLLSGK